MEYKKYTIAVIILYIILLPIFFVYHPQILKYDFNFKNFYYIIFICAISILGLYLMIRKFIGISKNTGINLKTILAFFVYAIIIGAAEEIIFRGLIQGFLHSYFNSELTPILLSSFIFGIAHLPNSANGLHVKKWNWKLAIVACVGGLPLGTLFALTDSLLIPTILHSLFLMMMKSYNSRF